MARAIAFALVFANVLYAAPKLTLDRIALHQFEDGDLLESGYEFLPGETGYMSCRISGYQVDETDETHRKVKLAWNVEVRDPAGVLLEAPAQGRIDTELFKEDIDWLPKFLKSFVVPPFAPSGEYRISVRVHDEIADSNVSGELKFNVHGHAVTPSPILSIGNFTFLSNEDDTFGMREPFYKPGDTAWVRLDVTGYKLGPNNRFSISFGMAVENPDGKQLFAQPDAGAEAHESFYPQGYVPGMLSFTLDKNVTPGTYTLVVTVHDHVMDQSAELRQPFRVQ